MIHRGEIFEKAIRNCGIPISKLAKRINYNRKSFYDFFTYSDLNLDIIYQVGKIIGYDFSKDIPELKSYNWKPNTATFENSANYKQLYFDLLEEQNKLLIEMLKLKSK